MSSSNKLAAAERKECLTEPPANAQRQREGEGDSPSEGEMILAIVTIISGLVDVTGSAIASDVQGSADKLNALVDSDSATFATAARVLIAGVDSNADKQWIREVLTPLLEKAVVRTRVLQYGNRSDLNDKEVEFLCAVLGDESTADLYKLARALEDTEKAQAAAALGDSTCPTPELEPGEVVVPSLTVADSECRLESTRTVPAKVALTQYPGRLVVATVTADVPRISETALALGVGVNPADLNTAGLRVQASRYTDGWTYCELLSDDPVLSGAFVSIPPPTEQ